MKKNLLLLTLFDIKFLMQLLRKFLLFFHYAAVCIETFFDMDHKNEIQNNSFSTDREKCFHIKNVQCNR